MKSVLTTFLFLISMSANAIPTYRIDYFGLNRPPIYNEEVAALSDNLDSAEYVLGEFWRPDLEWDQWDEARLDKIMDFRWSHRFISAIYPNGSVVVVGDLELYGMSECDYCTPDSGWEPSFVRIWETGGYSWRLTPVAQSDHTSVPEPGTIVLMVVGLLAVGASRLSLKSFK